jgi:hypothetical protein
VLRLPRRVKVVVAPTVWEAESTGPGRDAPSALVAVRISAVKPGVELATVIVFRTRGAAVWTTRPTPGFASPPR